MAPTKPHIRRAAAIAGSALLAVSLTAPAAAAGTAGGLPASQSSSAVFNTLHELQQARGLSGTVRTLGDEYPDDGAGMTYTVTPTRPSDATAHVAMPLADGQWAVPQGFAAAPSTQLDTVAAEDTIARGQTFVDVGAELQWDASRPTPLTGKVVKTETSAPYPVTCSSFVGMALMGWNYNSTTYVADKNTQVGYAVDFGPDAEGSSIWQANNLASWFYANGDLWLDTDGHYQRGDILFFSNHNPTVAPGSAPGARSTFGNVYHVAIYLGDGMLMHSTGRAAGQGVHVSRMGSSLEADLSFVARPHWGGSTQGGSQGGSTAPNQSATGTEQGQQGGASQQAAPAPAPQQAAPQDGQGAAPQDGQGSEPQTTESASVNQDTAQGQEQQGSGQSGTEDSGQQGASSSVNQDTAQGQEQQGSGQSGTGGSGQQGASSSAGPDSTSQSAAPGSSPSLIPGSQSTAVAVINASDVEGDANQPTIPAENKAQDARSGDSGSSLPVTGPTLVAAAVAALLLAGGAGLVLMRRISARRAVGATTGRVEH